MDDPVGGLTADLTELRQHEIGSYGAAEDGVVRHVGGVRWPGGRLQAPPEPVERSYERVGHGLPVPPHRLLPVPLVMPQMVKPSWLPLKPT